MQLDNAVRKLLYTEQAERHLTMPRRKEGNAFADENGHDGDDELVDRLLVQERRDDLASAHHPNVLARLRAEAFGKGSDGLGNEADTSGHGSRRRLPREHIVHGIRAEMRAQLQTPVEGLAAEDLRVGGALEFGETVKTLGSRTFGQLIEIAIRPSDVAIGAGRDIHDDSSLRHDADCSLKPRDWR